MGKWSKRKNDLGIETQAPQIEIQIAPVEYRGAETPCVKCKKTQMADRMTQACCVQMVTRENGKVSRRMKCRICGETFVAVNDWQS